MGLIFFDGCFKQINPKLEASKLVGDTCRLFGRSGWEQWELSFSTPIRWLIQPNFAEDHNLVETSFGTFF